MRKGDLELSSINLLNLSTTSNTLRVDINAENTVTDNSDTLVNSGWVQGADVIINTTTYNTYTNGAAEIQISEVIA